MPTPFTHLYMAQQVLADHGSPPNPLQAHAGDFLLGAIAPDAWTLGHLTRQQAHLVPVPMPRDRSGHQELLRTYPQMRAPADLTPAQAAFVAGYLSHLFVDELWYHDIFDPFFARGAGDHHGRRFILHNVLRIHWEKQFDDQLHEEMVDALAAADAGYGLPPVPDSDVQEFRDQVSAEMRPGAPRRTVEVFASRLGVAPAEIEKLLGSSDVMQDEILGRLPADCLSHMMQAGIRGSQALVSQYLAGQMTDRLSS